MLIYKSDASICLNICPDVCSHFTSASSFFTRCGRLSWLECTLKQFIVSYRTVFYTCSHTVWCKAAKLDAITPYMGRWKPDQIWFTGWPQGRSNFQYSKFEHTVRVYSTHVRTFWRRATKFGTITHRQDGNFWHCIRLLETRANHFIGIG